jgi:maltose O-acetyltransferase
MSGENEKTLNGALYDPHGPELVAERERARDLTRRHNRTPVHAETDRRKPLGELLASLGDECVVEPPFRCDYGYHPRRWGFLREPRSRHPGRLSGGHRPELPDRTGRRYLYRDPPARRERAVEGPEYGEPVAVGDDVWIGGRAVLNPGVTVGDNSVLAS